MRSSAGNSVKSIACNMAAGRKENGDRAMDVFKFGLRYWKKYAAGGILTKAMSCVALGADLLLPLITSMFINYVMKDNPPADDNILSFLLSGKYGAIHSMELFWTLAILFVGLILLKEITVYIRNIINQKLGLGLETDLRRATFHKLMELDSDTISRYNTGELLTILNSDTIMFKELFCRIIPHMFDAVFVLVTAILLLAGINPYLLIIPVILIPFFATALLRFRKLAKQNFTLIRANNSNMSLTVQENIEAVRLVRSFTNEKLEKEKFNAANQKVKESYVKQVKLSSSFEAVFSLIRQTAYIGSIAVGAILVMNGHMLIGYLVACADYVMKIMQFVTQINNCMFQMQQQLVSGRKMMDFMSCETKIPNGDLSAKPIENVHLQIQQGTMCIQGKTVLRDINLDIPYGKKVGIVGGTGCGKSVLLESLIRVHDLTGGCIKLNDKDVREYDLDSLREKFSYVFQDVFLFSNTIDSNIAYAQPDIGRQQVYRAAMHAQAHGFIQHLLDGYDTIVGERGLGISGGQKQRVSIARALLREAPILVLDDSTSALDMNTEKKLLRDIKENYPEKTLLISAHRMSSVVDCDEIIYMRDGMILERGTFEELMAMDGHFASVYRIQETQEGTVNFDALAEAERGM